MKGNDQYRHNNDFEQKQSYTRSQKRLNRKYLESLSKKIEDKIWWESLSSDQKIGVLNMYQRRNYTWADGEFTMEKFETKTKKKIFNKKEERRLKIQSLLK